MGLAAAVFNIVITRTRGDMSQAAAEADMDRLWRLLIYVTVISVFNIAVSAVRTYIKGRYLGNAEFSFKENFAKHFLRLPFSRFEKHNSGEMLSVFSRDMHGAISFITSDALDFIQNILNVAAYAVFMIMLKPLYTVIFLAMFPVFIFIQVKSSQLLRPKYTKLLEENAYLTSIINDSFQNVSTIAAYSLEEFAEERYLTAYHKFYTMFLKYVRTHAFIIGLGMILSNIPLIFAFSAAGLAAVNGDMSLAEFVAYTSIATSAASVLMMLSQKVSALRQSQAGAERLNGVIGEEFNEAGVGGGIEPVPSAAAVSFNNVCFSYNDDGEAALDSVTFDIMQGERVAIVGGSGSGKSTILKLLLGLYECGAGNVSVLGKDIKSVGKAALRGMLAYVPQDSFMFPDTIRANIQLANPGDINEARLEQVCNNAGIWDFITELPAKLDTVLSESAENVSGGQRQRLAIARAFFKDAPIVLFDEATSSLDPTTEAEVLGALERLMEGRTVLMVAHRAKAIAACGRIIVMDNGHISGVGTHSELIADNAVYRTLYASFEKEKEGAVA